VGFLQFLSFWQVLVDQILAMEFPRGVPTIPQSLVQNRGAIRETRSWI
jgi:hypothetical protein